uniref:Uncharacterized protein n=1 Tax=Amphimedon queenslandica TaxID=400682 RepID=A0A1X7U1M6_AMPQE
MDSYAKQWLQFAFPLYLWIIIIIIIQLCRRYGKISRLMGSHAVSVLSTLTFLSYTKLVRTIVIVLHKREVTLHCTNESVRSVSLWYEDPNVEYAKGKHAGLFGFALLVSVSFAIPYTLFLLCHPVLEKYLSHFKLFKSWSHFKPIIDAYSGPMKDEYRFWPGLLLVTRITVLLIVTFLQNESRVLLLAVAAIILSLSFIFGGVYRKKLNNIIEFWFLLNLCIMASLSIAFTDESKLSHMKCYDALIKKLFKKQDEDDEPLLDVTESHLTVDQQRRAMVPSSTDIRRCASHESVVDFSSCSVSSGQYYVSDDCSSVTQSPCNPLSVYAGNMSQYNNTIFYFIGTSVINFNVTIDSLSLMKCYDALIKKLFKKQDENDDPLLDVTESYLTVDQQRRAMVPSSTDVRRCASRESVVDLF